MTIVDGVRDSGGSPGPELVAAQLVGSEGTDSIPVTSANSDLTLLTVGLIACLDPQLTAACDSGQSLPRRSCRRAEGHRGSRRDTRACSNQADTALQRTHWLRQKSARASMA